MRKKKTVEKREEISSPDPQEDVNYHVGLFVFSLCVGILDFFRRLCWVNIPVLESANAM